MQTEYPFFRMPAAEHLAGKAPTLARLAGAAADLVFPRSCVHCGGPVENPPFRHLCGACADELFLVEGPACQTCGHPFFGALEGPRTCPHCIDLVPEFDAGKTLFLAKGAGRSLLHELKYRNGRYVLRDLGTLVERASAYRRYLADARLVPVPLHPVKERERGFNQSGRIARLLCAAAGEGARVDPLLQRTRHTRSQTRLSRRERRRNMKNAFALAPGVLVDEDENYIVVDDVFTTGATLNACCRVLRQAGARNLRVVTLGHG